MATFQKCGCFKNWWPWAMQSETNLWHLSNSRKASNSRDVGNSKDPSSNRNVSLYQGHQQEKVRTTSTAKTLATAGSVCGKAIKVAGNAARNMAVNVAVIKKNLVAVKGPQVCRVFLLGVAVKACRDLATLTYQPTSVMSVYPRLILTGQTRPPPPPPPPSFLV